MIEAYRPDIGYAEWDTKVTVQALLTDEGRGAGAPQPDVIPGTSSIEVYVLDDWSSDEFERAVNAAQEDIAKWCSRQNEAMDLVRCFVEQQRLRRDPDPVSVIDGGRLFMRWGTGRWLERRKLCAQVDEWAEVTDETVLRDLNRDATQPVDEEATDDEVAQSTEA